MYKCINGWTKEKMLRKLRSRKFEHKSESWDGRCLYVADDGNMCGVGMFIPKKMYTKSMEGSNARTVIRKFKLADKMPLGYAGMEALQAFHDGCYSEKAKQEMIDWVKENVRD